MLLTFRKINLKNKLNKNATLCVGFTLSSYSNSHSIHRIKNATLTIFDQLSVSPNFPTFALKAKTVICCPNLTFPAIYWSWKSVTIENLSWLPSVRYSRHSDFSSKVHHHHLLLLNVAQKIFKILIENKSFKKLKFWKFSSTLFKLVIVTTTLRKTSFSMTIKMQHSA